MEHPVEELMSEHRLILRMLAELERRVVQDEGGEFPADFVARALDFFATFADARHHAKEERVLFPALIAAGMPCQGGPVAVMENEHVIGRACLAKIREELPAARGGSAAAASAIRAAAREYCSLLTNHIWKEDNILFRMSRELLWSEEDQQRLQRQFHDAADPLLSEQTLRKYEAVVNEAESQCAASSAAGAYVRST
ncbi:MAG: hemerythrin domain-containing protein [Candidatus Solibacter usitatus]|nr:hemerythrin domain-containing protein [Candidatus Solibacter usitatus]